MRATTLLLTVPVLALATACGGSTGPKVATQPLAGGHQAPGHQAGGRHQPTTTTATGSDSLTTGDATCATSDLKVTLGGGQGAMGSTYLPLVFTNNGASACTLDGYPGVSFVAPDSGKQVGAAADRNAQHPATTLTLAAGDSASAIVQIAETPNYPASRCAPTAVSGLRVYPPGNTAAAYVPFDSPTQECSSDVGQLSVEAVVSGTTGM